MAAEKMTGGGEIMQEIASIAWVSGLWVLWCALHSLLIAAPVVGRFEARLGKWFAWYRLGYVALSSITLLPLFFYSLHLPQQLLFDWTGGWRLVQLLLLGYALFMFLAGAREYDLGYFLEWRQIRAQRHGEALPPLPFATSGIHRYVRHPWYSGGIVFVWGGGPVTTVNLAVKGVLTVYLLVGTLLEERKLAAAVGTRYRDYQRQVPMLIPWRRRQ